MDARADRLCRGGPLFRARYPHPALARRPPHVSPLAFGHAPGSLARSHRGCPPGRAPDLQRAGRGGLGAHATDGRSRDQASRLQTKYPKQAALLQSAPRRHLRKTFGDRRGAETGSPRQRNDYPHAGAWQARNSSHESPLPDAAARAGGANVKGQSARAGASRSSRRSWARSARPRSFCCSSSSCSCNAKICAAV